MNIVVWLSLSVVASLLEVVFISYVFQQKYPIKRYRLFVALVTVMTVVNYFLPFGVFNKMLLVVFWGLYPFCIVKRFSAVFYTIVPYLILAALQWTIISLAGENEMYAWLANFVVILCLNIALTESKQYIVQFNFERITLKVFAVIFSLVFLAFSIYFTNWKGWF